MDLRTFFNNPFSNLKVGYEKFRKFCEIHLQRIAAQNLNGKYDKMYTETTAAYTNLFGAITNKDNKFSTQQSFTLTVHDVFLEFKQKISQKEGTIKGIWDKGTAIYEEFFPHGLTEYAQATLANVETLMKRVVTVSQAHAAEIGQPFVDLFTDIHNRFTTARTGQLKKIGEVKDSSTTSGNVRDEMEKQLMKNLLTLALEYMDNPDAGMAFFDQSILKSSQAKDNGGDGAGTPPDAQG